MVQSTGSVASLLSQVYQNNTNALNTSMSRIASGKRVVNAGDDFGAFIKAASVSSKISQYQQFNRDLATAKSATDYMLNVGNTVMDTLAKMKTNREAIVGADGNQIAALNAQFSAMAAQMNNFIANAKYDNVAAYAVTEVSNAAATIGGTAYAINVTAGTIAANPLLASTSAQIQTEMNNASIYIANVQAIQDRISQQISLNKTIASSYEAQVSVLTDVDEADEMGKVTALQVRQQATASMMAQANTSQAAIARLFQ